MIAVSSIMPVTRYLDQELVLVLVLERQEMEVTNLMMIMMILRLTLKRLEHLVDSEGITCIVNILIMARLLVEIVPFRKDRNIIVRRARESIV